MKPKTKKHSAEKKPAGIRLVLISDTHGYHNEMPPIPGGDILIHAGDITRYGRFEELGSINTFFEKLPHPHKVCIAGNHDRCFEMDKERAKGLLPCFTYLQDEAVEIMGLRVYGSPWQPRFFDWAFNLDRGPALAQVWAKIPKDTDILITHGPPQGICDFTDYRREHAGCVDLLEAVNRVRPKVHVFGHIHEGYGSIETEGTIFVNASICTANYSPVNLPVVLDVFQNP